MTDESTVPNDVPPWVRERFDRLYSRLGHLEDLVAKQGHKIMALEDAWEGSWRRREERMAKTRDESIMDVLVTFGVTAETISRDGLVAEIVLALDTMPSAAMRGGPDG